MYPCTSFHSIKGGVLTFLLMQLPDATRFNVLISNIKLYNNTVDNQEHETIEVFVVGYRQVPVCNTNCSFKCLMTIKSLQ